MGESRQEKAEVASTPTYPSNPGAVPGEGPPLQEEEECWRRAEETEDSNSNSYDQD